MRRYFHLIASLAVAYGVCSTALSQSYTHDDAGQLISVSYPSGELIRYSYDLRGNLVRSSTFTLVPGGGELLLLPESNWRYLDDGTLPPNQGAIPWFSRIYNDSAWSSGSAKLGYGGNQSTTVSYGSDANNKHITTYFRTVVFVADANPLSTVTIQLLRDDGAVVYVNGTEVFRSNMPSGPIDNLTLASSELTGSEESRFVSFSVPRSFIGNGANVIAVEVHQAAPDSPDLAFDLALQATVNPKPPEVSIVSPSDGQFFNYSSNVLVRATASDTDGRVTLVEFFDGTRKIGEDSTPPYEAIVSDLVPGEHFLTAVAADNGQLQTTSSEIWIAVTDPFGLFVPTLTIDRVGADLVLGWEGVGFYLQIADAPEGPWNTIVPLVNGGSFTIPAPADSQFFRLTNTPE
jgi:YD repeat-containing protein